MAYQQLIKGTLAPKLPGICALFTTHQKESNLPNYVFISELKDLRARQIAWEFHFRNCATPEYVPIITATPNILPENWAFKWWLAGTTTVENVEASFKRRGYTLMGNAKRKRKLTHAGKTGTLAELCREFGIDYNHAYYQLGRRGSTLEEIFGGKS